MVAKCSPILWLIHIAGSGLGLGLRFGLQTLWLHSIIQNFSHWFRSGSGSLSLSICIVQESESESGSANVNEPLVVMVTEYSHTSILSSTSTTKLLSIRTSFFLCNSHSWFVIKEQQQKCHCYGNILDIVSLFWLDCSQLAFWDSARPISVQWGTTMYLYVFFGLSYSLTDFMLDYIESWDPSTSNIWMKKQVFEYLRSSPWSLDWNIVV